jgi:cell division transport system permease protein
MLVEGLWWENEAKTMLAEVARENASRGYGQVNYRYMLLPAIEGQKGIDGKGNGTVFTVSDTGGIVVVKQEDAKKLQPMLEVLPNIRSVSFISREEAMQNFVSQYPEEEMFRDLDANILQDRFAIRIHDLADISATVAKVKSIEGIESVNGYEEVAGGFVTVRNVATVVCVTLIVILFVVSVFIISNTVRLTTFDRREEIAIMRMVGATNGFIRGPFVYEGFLMGLLSAAIAFGCQWGLYTAVTAGVTRNDTMQLLSIIPFENMRVAVGVAFGAAGLLMGVGGSLSAIRKFLRV